MTSDQILSAIQSSVELQALLPDTVAIAQALSDHKSVQEYWLTDRGLVADLTASTGSIDMAESILEKLDAASVQSRAVKAIINRLFTDARGINFGDYSMRSWIEFMTPSLFTEDERDALLNLALQPDPPSEYEVRVAIFNDDGSLKV